MRIFIRTFGCQMNDYDSERMAGVLAEEGHEQVQSEQEADCIIVNTCSVRKHAEDRALSYIGRHSKEKKVVVAGCMAQSEGGNLIKDNPEIFAVVGTYNFTNIGDILKQESGGVYTEMKNEKYLLNPKRQQQVKGYAAIMQGCNNYCSYCIVPYVRGRERSRPAEEITEELNKMASFGYREVMLLGQNVNSYYDAKSGTNFTGLLKKAAGVEGIYRIRFMTSHPKDLTYELVEAVAEEKKLCSHFHLPLQAGSDRILKLMNRKYTSGEYAEKILKIREKVKGVSVTSDILVGFPGETEEEFKTTVSMVEGLRFDDVFVFKYSERKGTKSAEYHDDISEEEKLTRLNYILDLQKKIRDDINKGYIGSEQEVLVYGASYKNTEELKAATDNNKKVFVKGSSSLAGTLQRVKIEEIRGQSFGGKLI